MKALLFFLVACNAPIPTPKPETKTQTVYVVRALETHIVTGTEMRATSDALAYSYALCEEDELVLSGGCELGGMPTYIAGPSLRDDGTAGGWYCEAGPGNGNVQAYVICAR